MALLPLSSFFTSATIQQLYAKGLQIADTLGLQATTWREGDPSKAQFYYLAEILASLEGVVGEFLKAGFLDYAEGGWLTVLADQVYNVQRIEATNAAEDLVLSNSGGAQYTIDPGQMTFRSSVTEKTYTNTSGGILASGPGTTLTVSWVADEPGSDSSVAADEIDEIVTALAGVSVASSVASSGQDAELDAALKQRCKDSRGALSPNGPADAYDYVARNPTLTGTTEVTKSSTVAASATGDVTVYLAGTSGPVTEPARAAVEAAITQWATPLTTTPTVLNSVAVPVTISVDVFVYDSVGLTVSEIQDAVRDAFADTFADIPIGGNAGFVDPTLLVDAAFGAVADVYKVSFFSPASAVAIAANEVPTISGTPTVNVTVTEAP